MSAAPLDAAWATTAERVFAAVSPSVVVVEAAQQGSGVVVISGVVATNCHVIGEAGRIIVRRGRIGHAASLVRSDRDRDVCLLEVPTLEAPSVTMRRATDLRVGAAVYAVGAPQGLELSLSAGLVSQLRGAEGGPLIQTTAPVSPGSSGGGLFDERGALVGLTTFQLGRGQNLNFAVPVEWVAAAVNELFAWRRCRAAPEPRCVIEEALAAARDISDARSRSSALGEIAEAQARAGDIAGALATARVITDPHSRSWALSAIAAAQARAGDRQGSERTFASALSTARESTDWPQFLALSAIARAQARAGDFAGAMATTREIADVGWRSRALSTIAVVQATAQDFTGALATAREIDDPFERSWALFNMAAAQAGAGDWQASARTFDSALATAREIPDLFQRARALGYIAAAQAAAGNGEASARTYASALGTAREIVDPRLRSWALREIVAAQARTGLRSGRTFASALATAREIPDHGERSMALGYIASAQARGGDIAGAMATAREIADPSALREIAVAEARAGNGSSALETIDALRSPAERARGLAQVASALASPRQEPRNER